MSYRLPVKHYCAQYTYSESEANATKVNFWTHSPHDLSFSFNFFIIYLSTVFVIYMSIADLVFISHALLRIDELYNYGDFRGGYFLCLSYNSIKTFLMVESIFLTTLVAYDRWRLSRFKVCTIICISFLYRISNRSIGDRPRQHGRKVSIGSWVYWAVSWVWSLRHQWCRMLFIMAIQLATVRVLFNGKRTQNRYSI